MSSKVSDAFPKVLKLSSGVMECNPLPLAEYAASELRVEIQVALPRAEGH